MTAAADTSGNKNSIQALGSTQQYLMRYTLVASIGLATSKDDDGQSAGKPVQSITEKQVMDLNDLIEETANGRPNHRKAFLAFMKVETLADIAAKDYQRAIAAINSTRVKS